MHVVRKELDVDRARRLIDGGWLPHHHSVVVDSSFGHQSHLVVSIGAVDKRKWSDEGSGESGPHNYLESVVRPATELKNACLLVERKIFHVYFAGGLVNSGWFPFDQPLVIDGRLGRQRYLEVTVGTAMLRHIYKPALAPVLKCLLIVLYSL